jgi:magnesium chelatase accessory protein
MPLSGLPGLFFLPMAKFLANSPVWARIMANSAADSRATHRLLERTGSAIDERGTELYSRLLRNKGHTAAALGMMANWDLVPLRRRLPDLDTAVTLIVGDKDQMVPPAQAEQVNRMMRRASVKCFRGYGHLLHEEIPEEIAAFILALDAGAREQAPV